MGQSRDAGAATALRRRAAEADRVEPRGIRRPKLSVSLFLKLTTAKRRIERWVCARLPSVVCVEVEVGRLPRVSRCLREGCGGLGLAACLLSARLERSGTRNSPTRRRAALQDLERIY